MIKEKYISWISYILIIFALILCSFIYFYNKFTPQVLIQPEYVEKIFNKDKIIDINISISDENFKSLIENASEEKYVVADVTVNDTTIKNVGIRAKGNSSLRQIVSDDESDRFSFKINFSEYVSDQNLFGLEKLVLNNMIGDPTYMKEYLSYDLMEFLNVNTPAYAFADIKINGEDWGLYLAVEPIEQDFLERYYGKDYGNLYKPESMEMDANKNVDKVKEKPVGTAPQMEIKNNNEQPMQTKNKQRIKNINDEPVQDDKNPQTQNNNTPKKQGSFDTKETSLVYIDDNESSYTKIFDSVVTKGLTDLDKQYYIKMVKALNSGEDLEKYLDVDEILRYFAVNTFLVNLDSYAGSMKHNYYLYEKNGIFQILPWDFNLSFGTFEMEDPSKAINFPIDSPVTDSMENSPLISKLLEVDEYKQLYHSYLETIVTGYINSGYFENTVNKLNNLIYDKVKNDATAFYTIDEYNLGVENLIIFGEDRAKSVQDQLENKQPSTEYGNIETSLDLKALGTINSGREAKNMDKNFMEENINIDFKNNQTKQRQLTNTKYLLQISIYIILAIISIGFVKLYKRKKITL